MSQTKEKELQTFGFSFAGGMAILTGLALWRDWIPAVWITSSVLAGWHLLGALVRPYLLRPTFAVVHAIGSFVSLVLTTTAFTLFFFLILTPFGFFLRLFGKDAIRPHGAGSAWEDVPSADNDPAKIEKLF